MVVTLFVGRLSSQVDDEGLKELFVQFGNLLSVQVIRDRLTGNSKGCGLITFSDPITAQTVLTYSEGREIYGKPIHVEYMKPR